MFERYTDKARRVIFFARFEASQLGANSIEPIHLLLALLREDKLLQTVFRPTLEEIRQQILALEPATKLEPGSRDLPISQATKHLLATAAQESERLHEAHIGTKHLLLALIGDKDSLASRILLEHGLTAEKLLPLLQNANQQVDETENTQEQGIAGGLQGSVPGSSSGSGPFFDEFYSRLADKSGITHFQTGFTRLLELLVKKGVITEEEKQDIIKPHDG